MCKKILSKGVGFDKNDSLCNLHSNVYYIVNFVRISTPFFIKIAQRKVLWKVLSKPTVFDKETGKRLGRRHGGVLQTARSGRDKRR